MYILGISCYYHDAAAALLEDGRLVAAAEEERFTRIKHDFGFPEQAIGFCLRRAGIRGEDLDCVVFYEKPFQKFERILMTVFQGFPRSWKVFREAMITWLADKLWVKSLIQQMLRVSEKKILFSEHHLSHAASAFYPSPFEESAILTIDGVGEWATATLGYGKGTDIRLTKEIRFPHSLGLLYNAFTAFLGFEVNEGEYKVLGMAPYGQPRHVDKIYDHLDLSGVPYEYIPDDDRLLDRVIDDLTQGRVVGWFQGRFEWGPRALGNRSILADPRSEEMKDLVNVKIKFRESFRPFAPVILEENVAEFFDGKDLDAQYPARYMLLVLPLKEGKAGTINTVNHLGTGRLQTIREEWNPRYYRVVRKFAEATGVPVLLNTSFNLRGEPIVTTPANAFNTFSKSGIDVLILENFMIRKERL